MRIVLVVLFFLTCLPLAAQTVAQPYAPVYGRAVPPVYAPPPLPSYAAYQAAPAYPAYQQPQPVYYYPPQAQPSVVTQAYPSNPSYPNLVPSPRQGYTPRTVPARAVAKQAATEPLLEIGFGLAGAIAPAYPASKNTNHIILPFPVITYRGDRLRADRGGARGILAEDNRFELSLSLSGSLPSDSNESDVRRGMPDLAFLAEIGPSLRYTFWKESDEKMRLAVPLRAAIALGGDESWIDYAGLVFNPELQYINERLFDAPLRFAVAAGPVFGFNGMNQYFYRVKPLYATATRPAYEADEGYMGSEATFSLAATLDERWRAFTATKVLFNQGAVNEASPLYEQDVNASFVLGVSYMFYRSDEQVPGGRE